MADNLIFLHLPKNGGRTIHRLLERLYTDEAVFTIHVVDGAKLNTKDFINLPEQERQKIQLLKGHMFYGLHQQLSGTSQYFTFLRKPEDRIISFYHYVLDRPKHNLHERVVQEKMSLYDFVTQFQKRQDLHNCQVRFISGRRKGTESAMLEKAIEHIDKHFSFVGLLEYFDESLLLLQQLHGWSFPYYKIQNQAKKRIAANDLDDKTRAAIAELNHGDQQLYDLMKKRFEAQLAQYPNLKLALRKLHLYNSIYFRVDNLFGKKPKKYK